MTRPRNASEKPAATARRTVALPAAALLVALAAVIVLYPSPSAVAEGMVVNRAVKALPFSPASGEDVGAGAVQLALPDGSSLVHDERSQRKVYRFARDLDLGMLGKRHVAFELTGYTPGDLPGDSQDVVVGTRPHLAIQERSPRPGWLAEYVEPKRADMRPFGIVIAYEQAATDPVAMSALIGRILDSFRGVRQ